MGLMDGRELVYRGKTKDVYRLDGGRVLLRFKDDVTGTDGVFDPGANTVGLSIEGIGRENLAMSAHFFGLLKAAGLKTHFISANLEENTMEALAAVPFGKGVEVICRRRAAGSFVRRYGAYVESDAPLPDYVEMTLKDDARGDPLITQEALEILGIMEGKGKPDYARCVAISWSTSSMSSAWRTGNCCSSTRSRQATCAFWTRGSRWRRSRSPGASSAGRRAMPEIREECGVLGVYRNRPGQVAADCYLGLCALQHRGQESCGIAVNEDGLFRVHQDAGLVSEVMSQRILAELGQGQMAVGHVRYGTDESRGRANMQPIVINHRKGRLALANNGALTNYASLRNAFESSGHLFHTTGDAEVISCVVTRERLGAESTEEALLRAMDYLEGKIGRAHV